MKAVWLTALVAMSLMSIVPAMAQAEALDSSADSEFARVIWPCYFVKITTTQQNVNVPGVGSATVYGRTVCI